MRILAIDDDPIILDLLRYVLGSMGLNDHVMALSAEAGYGAIAEAEAPFDCILLDLQMPQVTGIDACRHIRALPGYSDTPILAVTAMSDRAYVDAAFNAGANDYVTKPFELTDLQARLKMVETTVKERKAMRAQADTLSKIQSSARQAPSIGLYDAIVIDDIDGLIDFAWFENYVQQLGRSDRYNSGVVSVGIETIASLHSSTSAYEFHGIICDVAECIAEAMSGHRCMFSYAGAGVFCLVLDIGTAKHRDEMLEEITAQIQRMGIRNNAGVPVDLPLDVGRSFRISLRDRVGGAQAVRSAAQDMLQRLGLTAAPHLQLETNDS